MLILSRVWAFKSWAVLDKVAEKAVANLEKFLNDLTPAGKELNCYFLIRQLILWLAERARIKTEVTRF